MAELARRQRGIVSRTQMLALGLGKSAIAEWVAKGRLHRVHRGVYVVGYPHLTRNGGFMAAVIACVGGAALSQFSAAVLWGMLNGDGKIHVTAPLHRGGRGLVVHRAPLEEAEIRKRAGIPVTAPTRTLIDLSDVAPARTLERAIDEAEYLRLDCKGLEPRQGRNGRGRLASVLAVHVGACATATTSRAPR